MLNVSFSLFIGLFVWSATTLVHTTANINPNDTVSDSEIECYQCEGTLGDANNNCGDTLYHDDIINTTTCTNQTVCAKVIIYMIEQKITIVRGCAPQCQDGCVKDEQLASHCYYCCQDYLCNNAVTITRNYVKWFTVFMTILQVQACRFLN
ncbi:uncharacterized protein LOC117295268 [Asterias rubens]|uniref:uncharacterized protein LOC117295268 n=1 Tax=Asterias rubens TaxID=7604 RepID=UPI00145500D3|nr:uncharacterized protein LOC117295268 [Asterias rubens]